MDKSSKRGGREIDGRKQNKIPALSAGHVLEQNYGEKKCRNSADSLKKCGKKLDPFFLLPGSNFGEGFEIAAGRGALPHPHTADLEPHTATVRRIVIKTKEIPLDAL